MARNIERMTMGWKMKDWIFLDSLPALCAWLPKRSCICIYPPLRNIHLFSNLDMINEARFEPNRQHTCDSSIIVNLYYISSAYNDRA